MSPNEGHRALTHDVHFLPSVSLPFGLVYQPLTHSLRCQRRPRCSFQKSIMSPISNHVGFKAFEEIEKLGGVRRAGAEVDVCCHIRDMAPLPRRHASSLGSCRFERVARA